MRYECLRCGFIAKQKIHLENHLNRKNKCEPTLEPISIEEVKIYYGFQSSSNIHQNSTNLHQNSTNIPPNSTNLHQSQTSNIHQNPPNWHHGLHQNTPSLVSHNAKVLECAYCFKTFSRSDSLNRHYGRCKIKKESKHTQEIQELKQIVDQLLLEKSNNASVNNSNNTNNTTNNNNTTNINNTNSNNNSNNITNNIILNNYGSENKDYITHDYLLELLKKPFQAIPELIKYTYFNDEHPENQNIKITNKKQPYIKIRKNDKWELADRKDTINDLIDQKHSELNDTDLYNIIDKKFKPCEVSRIERFNEKYMNDDKDFVSQLYKDTELVIINNS